jgi:hypothetical protein
VRASTAQVVLADRRHGMAAGAADDAAAVAAVARQFKTSGALLDAATLEPKTWVAIFNPDGSIFKEEMIEHAKLFNLAHIGVHSPLELSD